MGLHTAFWWIAYTQIATGHGVEWDFGGQSSRVRWHAEQWRQSPSDHQGLRPHL